MGIIPHIAPTLLASVSRDADPSLKASLTTLAELKPSASVSRDADPSLKARDRSDTRWRGKSSVSRDADPSLKGWFPPLGFRMRLHFGQ